MCNQCSSSSVSPRTPPSVTPESEWTLYSPKERKALPKREMILFFQVKPNDLPCFFKK